MKEKRGCNPLGWLFKRHQQLEVGASQGNSESPPNTYTISKMNEGFYVDWRRGEEVQARYFKTNGGHWFLLANSGPSAPFDEDADINPHGETAQYLSGLLETRET